MRILVLITVLSTPQAFAEIKGFNLEDFKRRSPVGAACDILEKTPQKAKAPSKSKLEQIEALKAKIQTLPMFEGILKYQSEYQKKVGQLKKAQKAFEDTKITQDLDAIIQQANGRLESEAELSLFGDAQREELMKAYPGIVFSEGLNWFNFEGEGSKDLIRIDFVDGKATLKAAIVGSDGQSMEIIEADLVDSEPAKTRKTDLGSTLDFKDQLEMAGIEIEDSNSTGDLEETQVVCLARSDLKAGETTASGSTLAGTTEKRLPFAGIVGILDSVGDSSAEKAVD